MILKGFAFQIPFFVVSLRFIIIFVHFYRLAQDIINEWILKRKS